MNFEELNELANISVNSKINEESLNKLFLSDTTSVYYKFLYNICNYYRKEKTNTVELGSYSGRSTAFLASGNPDGHVLTVDVSPMPDFKENISRYKNIEIFKGRSDSLELLDRIGKETVDICFFDTEHSYEVVKLELSLWLPKIKKGGILLFDDIFINDGMKKFWEEISFRKGFSKDLHWTGFGYAVKN